MSKIISIVPSSTEEKEPYVNILNKQSKNELSACLGGLKFGRPRSAQLLLDTLIATCKLHEEKESTIFEEAQR